LLLKVNVSYPEDMSILENKLAETLAKIFIKKLSEADINKLIEMLEDGSINVQL
jgi:hypothetical protein